MVAASWKPEVPFVVEISGSKLPSLTASPLLLMMLSAIAWHPSAGRVTSSIRIRWDSMDASKASAIQEKVSSGGSYFAGSASGDVNEYALEFSILNMVPRGLREANWSAVVGSSLQISAYWLYLPLTPVPEYLAYTRHCRPAL